MRINSLSVVVGAVDHTLLLMFLQDTGNNRLSNDTDAAIIHHGRPECVEPLCVYIGVGLQKINILIFSDYMINVKKLHILESQNKTSGSDVFYLDVVFVFKQNC